MKSLSQLSVNAKTIIISSYDILIIALSFILSYILRFGKIPYEIFSKPNFVIIYLIAITPQFLATFYAKIHQGLWRFSSTPDLLRIIRACTIGVASSLIFLFLFIRLEEVPRTVFFINWMLLVFGLGGGRFLYRFIYDFTKRKNTLQKDKNILIVGAGSGGEQVARQIQQNNNLNMNILGFIDDDIRKKGRLIHGKKVLGSIDNVKEIVNKTNPSEILIAIPSATSTQIRKIIENCKNLDIEIKTLPRLQDILNGKVEISQLRNVTPEDLLGREKVDLSTNNVLELITENTILITGAGGSIGSELSNQIYKLAPEHIIFFDITELFIYELEKLLESKESPKNSNVRLTYIIGDIRDESKLESIFKKYKPGIIFHAAAYKHVNIMENNPLEAIKTNIIGTKNLINLADKYQAKKLVLVSTDKAINPTNVMGTTKRIAEILCIEKQKTSSTKFIIVRFGNVLGSSGSVIPLFKKQIKSGGPVTVTHPEVTRYFMSIQEATQLVIKAGSMGSGGEIFVLKMGEPIKILNLAEQMISLSGLKPYKDIDIKITGLRPGEKLYEELFSNIEKMKETPHPKIYIANAIHNTIDLENKIEKLLSPENNIERIKDLLKSIVIEYNPPRNNSENNNVPIFTNLH